MRLVLKTLNEKIIQNIFNKFLYLFYVVTLYILNMYFSFCMFRFTYKVLKVWSSAAIVFRFIWIIKMAQIYEECLISNQIILYFISLTSTKYVSQNYCH